MCAWRNAIAGGNGLRLAVNISGAAPAARRPRCSDVAQALQESGLEPGNLVIELTESTIMYNTDANLERFHRLKALGVRLAIDDFGTGYSSLSYLHRFPIDILKIDRSFVSRLTNSDNGPELARAVITLGETLGLDTVAEGIELEPQVAALLELGCVAGQGFLFAQGRLARADLRTARSSPAAMHCGPRRPRARSCRPRAASGRCAPCAAGPPALPSRRQGLKLPHTFPAQRTMLPRRQRGDRRATVETRICRALCARLGRAAGSRLQCAAPPVPGPRAQDLPEQRLLLRPRRTVKAAISSYMEERLRVGANWDAWGAKNEAVRALVAEIIGAQPDEIAVTASASAGINSLASAMDFSGARNKVVISDFEFPTNAQIWHAQEPRGARVVHVPRAADGYIPLESFAQAIDEQTQLVAVTQVCFRNGAMLDIAGIAKLAHAKGAKDPGRLLPGSRGDCGWTSSSWTSILPSAGW